MIKTERITSNSHVIRSVLIELPEPSGDVQFVREYEGGFIILITKSNMRKILSEDLCNSVDIIIKS